MNSGGDPPLRTAPAPALAQEPSTAELPHVARCIYSCRLCRAVLFHEEDLLRHDSTKDAKGNKGFRRRWTDGDGRSAVCTSYFLDPERTPWVVDESREATAAGAEEVSSDTIYCPTVGCHAKVGSRSWTGVQCSCGAWVTPAFKVLGKAVDRMLESASC